MILCRTIMTMMYNLHYFLLGVCLFLSGTFCDETNMLEMISKECSFSKLYNNTQIDKLKALPEFEECKNGTAINSIKSSKQFSDDNLSNIRCSLYHESLVPICKNEPTADKLYELLNAKPEDTYSEDFCKNLVSSESETIKNVITSSRLCERLCVEFRDGKEVLNGICVKSYNFIKFLLELKQNVHISTVSKSTIENIEKEDNVGSEKKPNQIPADLSPIAAISSPENGQKDASNEIKGSQPGDTAVKQDNAPIAEANSDVKELEIKKNIETEPKQIESIKTPSNIKDRIVSYVSSSPQTPQVVESVLQAQKKAQQGDNILKSPGETRNIVSQPEGDELEPNNINIKIAKSSTVANNQAVNKAPLIPEEKVKINPEPEDIEAVNEQQSPPKLEDPNTAPGNDYGFEQEKTEQINEPKLDDAIIDPDLDDAVADSDKMPKVSQLSEQFDYNADVNGNSNFFTYFSFTCVIFIIGYVVYHNKTKVLALLVEGRHSRRTQRVRRPNIANYQKLDSNLEEAISSSVSKNPSHVIY